MQLRIMVLSPRALLTYLGVLRCTIIYIMLSLCLMDGDVRAVVYLVQYRHFSSLMPLTVDYQWLIYNLSVYPNAVTE